MAITLSPKQQAYVEDFMREGSFASEEIAIDEALRALHEERSAERTLEPAERGIASYREHGSLTGGNDLRKRVEERLRRDVVDGRVVADHSRNGVSIETL